MAQFETLNAMVSPRRATRGSAGLDLSSATRLILTPCMGIQLVDTDFKGPLPADTVGFILGRSSVTMQELIIHPGVIDPDFTGQIKIMVSSPRGIIAISSGDRIAQLLLLSTVILNFLKKIQNVGTRASAQEGFLMFFALWILIPDLY
ncbi:uncharacterized protein LOC110284566 [Mus caroli]|uniref:Uncharacterized protein LOC110284566 n=1 Tax=Mus caroli TaxID=10089 RepID=A0A6P5NVI5_MUSCR|nr:uncharacterized protein LOC110284566 [Mus caroli]